MFKKQMEALAASPSYPWYVLKAVTLPLTRSLSLVLKHGSSMMAHNG